MPSAPQPTAARIKFLMSILRGDLPRSRSLSSQPYSLFPIPYSLFPIPYSLFPIPYSLSPSRRQSEHHLVIESHEPIQLALEQPFLIAVHTESLRPILEIHRRTDPVALHPLGPQLRHVGRKRAHRRQRGHIVDAPVRRFDGFERLGVDARDRAGRPRVLRPEARLDRRIVDDPVDLG